MSKKKYKVIVREVLERSVEIESDSFVSGSEEAFKMYNTEELILTADDCISRDIFLEDIEEDKIFHIYSK